MEDTALAALIAQLCVQSGCVCTHSRDSWATERSFIRGVKQVDGMLSNDKIDDLDLARAHSAFVTMDWTGMDSLLGASKRYSGSLCVDSTQ